MFKSKMTLRHLRQLWQGHTLLEMADMIQLYADGQKVAIQREILKVPDSVVVLLYRCDNHKLILTSQWRAPIVVKGDDRPVIEACAGNIDSEDFNIAKGDAIQAAFLAAKREVSEETGWHIKDLSFIYALYSSPGLMTEKLYYFIASVDSQIHDGGGLRSEGEDITVLEISLSEALNKIKDGEIIDLKTIVLLQHLQLHQCEFF
ncbi:NUDIX domain-containing protein [Commensalibacter oyaizuii]|uniref:GDP-mannose pyrophosphatase n=1 Tax=Commensalibacter oyaizuii TaxID=3043873 RepID=A0ABT6PYK6_9PROT|nr:NUDIX hydrolase [Commensalibacter sp. TBRC 16381]MDI2089938.1 NUDIX hydrolase [Commensalibacter sp. TBRC 16381]